MPPAGGFATINVERTYPRPLLRQGFYGAILLAMTFNGVFYLRDMRKRQRVLKIEQQEHYIAVHPFMVAEQERKYLLQLHRIREDERSLMKDHPGWKVGTLYGEPVYKTIPEGELPAVSAGEFTIHRPDSEWSYKVMVPDWFK